MHHLVQLSLRLRGVAQARGILARASSFHLGESSTSGTVDLRAFPLRRDSTRPSETFACSKHSWLPERRLSKNSLGEPLLISPKQGMLAWVRKPVLTIVLSCNSPVNTTQTTPYDIL